MGQAARWEATDYLRSLVEDEVEEVEGDELSGGEKGGGHIYGHNTIRFGPLTIPEYLRDEIRYWRSPQFAGYVGQMTRKAAWSHPRIGLPELPVCTEPGLVVARRGLARHRIQRIRGAASSSKGSPSRSATEARWRPSQPATSGLDRDNVVTAQQEGEDARRGAARTRLLDFLGGRRQNPGYRLGFKPLIPLGRRSVTGNSIT